MDINKFRSAKIYRITSDTNDRYYIGSTCKSLKERLNKHKDDYRRYLSNKQNYISSFEIINDGVIDIELLEDFDCNSRNELHKREGEWIKANKIDVVNQLIAGRSNREWEKDNSEYYNAQQQDYRNKTKNKKKNYDMEYRLNNADKIKKMTICECGGKYQQKSKCYHLKTKKHIEYLESH